MNTAAHGRFTSRSRVRKRSEFLLIQASASRVVTPHLVLLVHLRGPMRALRRPLQPPDRARVGITVPKKTGCSPERSRAKRLIREVFRQQRGTLPPDVDVVVIVRKSLGELKLSALIEEWRRVERQIQKRIAEARTAATRAAETIAAANAEAANAETDTP
ncbi:MAG: ribonuclease P protein component [Polyangiaceae bacterium]|nr:ribonuclease P protein component [Polyangiaceae bacterium]